MNNSTFALIHAVMVGAFELNAILEYGVYPIPYCALFFIGISLVCGAIEKGYQQKDKQNGVQILE